MTGVYPSALCGMAKTGHILACLLFVLSIDNVTLFLECDRKFLHQVIELPRFTWSTKAVVKELID